VYGRLTKAATEVDIGQAQAWHDEQQLGISVVCALFAMSFSAHRCLEISSSPAILLTWPVPDDVLCVLL